MATVYKIEIKATSEWVSIPTILIEKHLEQLIEDNFKLVNVEINAEIVA